MRRIWGGEGRAGQGRAGRAGPVDDNVCGSYDKWGRARMKARIWRRGDVKASTIEKDEYCTPSNEFSEY